MARSFLSINMTGIERAEPHEFELDTDQFPAGVDTWNPDEREGRRIQPIEALGHLDAYAVSHYTHQNREGTLETVGRAKFSPIELDRSAIADALDDAGISPFSDAQWNIITDAYARVCQATFENSVFEGIPLIYDDTLYTDDGNWPNGVAYHLESLEEIVKRENTRDDDYDHTPDRDYELLTDDQHDNLNLIDEGISTPHDAPYTSQCQYIATIEFTDHYAPWQLRAIELLHNGVFANKPALAQTKSLLEAGLTQSDIADAFDKDPSTVSRQVSQIDDWVQRANWQYETERT